jgi:hypothetical protein
VVLTASILANARNQVALLFRDLGTDNVFVFHLTGDPYVTPSENEADRRPLRLEFVRDIKRMGTTVRDVGAQMIVPTDVEGQILVARAGGNESDTVLVEGATASPSSKIARALRWPSSARISRERCSAARRRSAER